MSAETAAWAKQRGLTTAGKAKWYVEIYLDVKNEPASQVYFGNTDSRFHLAVRADEWSFLFVHRRKDSHIRIDDKPCVHGSDDYELLKKTPTLAAMGPFLRELENRHEILFKRQHAFVRTNLGGGKQIIQAWVTTL